MSLIFLDCETTGLDPDRHDVWEIAWAVDDGPIESGLVRHTLDRADPDALAIGGHEKRCNLGHDPMAWLFSPDVVLDSRAVVREADLRLALEGQTLAGANPAFDAAFLRSRWRDAPWRYRLCDVEAYAMGALGYAEPQGLARIAADLTAANPFLEIPVPDHTAAGDVACVRACHRALRDIYEAAFERTA